MAPDSDASDPDLAGYATGSTGSRTGSRASGDGESGSLAWHLAQQQESDRSQLERLRELQDRARRRQASREAQGVMSGTGERLPSERVPSGRGPAGAQHASTVVWTDPSRPAGSLFSTEQWQAARDAHPDCSVFKMHVRQGAGSAAECMFMAVPRGRMAQQGLPAQILDGSLVDPWPAGGGLRREDCELNFRYFGGDGTPRFTRMRVVMRQLNPAQLLYAGSKIELALGSDASEVLESARQAARDTSR